MNILFTVCGRSGSKGVKNKNLKSFLSSPIVYYSLAAYQLYKQKNGANATIDICINTDSEMLISQVLVKESKAFIVKRSESLAGDAVPKIAVIKDCLQKAESAYNIAYDIVVDLDITSPLRRVRDITNAIDKKTQLKDIDIVFSVTSARRNPYFNMVKKNADGTYSQVIETSFTARQQTPEVFDMNGSIYVYDANFLRLNTSDKFFDGRCDIIRMPDTAVLDIDREEDFVQMEVLGEHYFSSDYEYGEIAQHAGFQSS